MLIKINDSHTITTEQLDMFFKMGSEWNVESASDTCFNVVDRIGPIDVPYECEYKNGEETIKLLRGFEHSRGIVFPGKIYKCESQQGKVYIILNVSIPKSSAVEIGDLRTDYSKKATSTDREIVLTKDFNYEGSNVDIQLRKESRWIGKYSASGRVVTVVLGPMYFDDLQILPEEQVLLRTDRAFRNGDAIMKDGSIFKPSTVGETAVWFETSFLITEGYEVCDIEHDNVSRPRIATTKSSISIAGRCDEPKIKGVDKFTDIVPSEEGSLGMQSPTHYRFDLIDPRVLFDVAETLAKGAEKYGDTNHLEIRPTNHINKALIHINAFLAGDTQDEHLTHAICRLIFASQVTKNDEEVEYGTE